ncbi:hypothetical protein Asulf_01851 [Archaeoglobus sulfaticallidus PM70-1]|uniref:UPF0182 protein Asulf_01851 n=1 Tax=Archaeoglobus sulfaticallidus PM70-1 TaxID=387631 RepID=N0BND1_9EURY|nr:UPF0182 family protein [Archaeoglobus sulfaticallidus]AGK61820.1 hypothetical protein Asulf_01851 [Archaeoglobus sulfaticallidus PM70-1]
MAQERLEISAPLDRKVLGALLTILILIILSSTGVYLYTEYLWFKSLDLGTYFVKTIIYRLELFGFFFTLSFLIFAINRFAMHKASEEFLGEPLKVPLWILFLLSLFIGYVLARDWIKFVFFQNAENFGISDPIFGIDVSFYVFKLPFLKDILYTILAIVIFCFLISVVYYFFIFRWVKSFEEFKELFPNLGYIHISALIAVILFIVGIYAYIGRFDLLNAQGGVLSGAGYTDVYVRIPSLLLISFISFLASIFAIYYGVKRQLEMLPTLFLIVIAIFFLAMVFAFAFQKVRVEPNEISLEEKYIEYSINFTRMAYGLDVNKKLFPVGKTLTIQDIERNKGIINNIRLWDHRPLLEVYRQLQQIRTYYYINDVDIDRYYINGNYTQIMISARELSTDLLQTNAQTWVNRHLIYTHGYGIIASPVNVVSEEGKPDFIVYDIPPKGEIEVDRPEIYFGELTNDYVIVKTKQKEFDYPSGERNVFTTYNGTGGVKIDSYLKKLLFSIRYGDVNLLLTTYLTPESRILIHRNILDRVQSVAPFLKYDTDPYIVVIDKKLYWIVDAYTVLDRFPYSAGFNNYGFFNYIRNSVKVYIDAYNGSLKFYVVDDEPVVKTLMKAFPELFIPSSEMSEEEKEHMRYPADLFKIQAIIYSIYHMDDPRTFYNKEDVWDIPTEMFDQFEIKMEPYYVMMNIGNRTEFILMLPFTPKDRNNIIAWMAGRCDKENYGEILLYEFPKGTLVYGPMQIEARIDQDPEISKIFTLWGQTGSRIIRGNLLVIPIDSSIIYVEPVYLRAENAQIPELRGVVIAYGNKIAMTSSLEGSLKLVFGQLQEESYETQDLQTLIKTSIQLYQNAMEEIRKGNWSGFGEYIEKLGEALKKMGSAYNESSNK